MTRIYAPGLTLKVDQQAGSICAIAVTSLQSRAPAPQSKSEPKKPQHQTVGPLDPPDEDLLPLRATESAH